MTLLIRAPESRPEARRYVLDVVFADWLGIDYELVFEAREDTSVRLIGDVEGRELTLADVFLATARDAWLSERSMPTTPLRRLGPDAADVPDGESVDAAASIRSLPVLFARVGEDGRLVHRAPARIDVGVDLLGGIFYLLTRYEEIVARARDDHDRFPVSATLAAAEAFVDRPIVDEYVDWLWSAMTALWPRLERREREFRLLLTHDVDHPWSTLGRGPAVVAHAMAGDIVRRRDPGLALRRLRALADSRSGRVDRDPFNTFDLLMETSERAGIRSTFYFMAGGSDPRYDGSYRIVDPPVLRLLRRIHERGHEVGLHASYHTFRAPGPMRSEFETLRAACATAGFDQPAWGVRQHYLRFEAPTTWQAQASAGFSHDSSIGFAELNGFRSGTCHEHAVFDVIAGVALPLRERPLIVMDAASDEYLAMDLAGAAASFRALVATCRRHAGDAVVLYHNSSLPAARQQAHYRELVASLASPG